MKVVGFGDNIVDRFVDRQVMYPGGNCANFAVFARRLGVPSAYMGVFGSDALGDFVRAALVDCGVELDRCIVREGLNGVTDIRAVNGDRVFLGWNDGGVTLSHPFVLSPDDLRYLATVDLVHSSVYSASESQLPQLSRAGTLISFDYSSEPEHRTDAYFAQTAPFIDLALLSLGDLPDQDATDELLRVSAAGACLALGTRGNKGALFYDGAKFYLQKAAPTEPDRFVDTMGCGDAFLTGLTVSLLREGWNRRNQPREPALRRALALAAEVAAEQCYAEGAFGYGRAVGAPTRI
ncbi:PfkB family carbohydrate kinase [Arthrobacter sp. R4-81]